jgi:hypothetical protein
MSRMSALFSLASLSPMYLRAAATGAQHLSTFAPPRPA